MKQVRNRVNIWLIANPAKLRKAVSKPFYKFSEIINPDQVMVREGRQKVRLNKPISVGFCILDLSNLVMYKLYYETLKPKHGDRLELLFTDTDSLCCEIETKDLYRDMEENINLYDISNFDPTHPLYSKSNHRILGKIKFETESILFLEFVGLKAKMYSLLCKSGKQKKVKEIKKNFVKNTSVMKFFCMSSEI